MIQINYDTNKDFDALALPPSMHEIIFVKGTPHEMGFQYGQKAKDMIVRNFFVILAQALQHYTREQLEQGLTEQQWDHLISSGQQFSAEVCGSLQNYVSPAFGEARKRELV